MIKKEGRPPVDRQERVGARCLNLGGPEYADGKVTKRAPCRRFEGHDIPHRSYHVVNGEESYYEWW